ncbi:uncharacterized protein [Diadema setosum]|uniref:uncharacterized protein n=1 Tax=Diadema setosum TaxID=31175 RepID=UPI003B3AF428
MDYNRKCIPLLTALLMICLVSSSLALEVYKFYEGRNVSLEFHQHLSSDSTFEYEIHSIDSSCYFCRNGTMIPGCLTHHQFRRFSVRSERSTTYLTVTLGIDTINSEDSQFYLFALREDRNGESYFYSQDVFIEVIRPSGPAECIVIPSRYSAAWNEVNCTSLLASDGEGSLYCFQDAEKASIKKSPTILNDHVTCIFWMNARLPIKCCSYEATFPITSHSCSQFVFYPATHIDESDTSITSELGITEQKFGEESNSATITPHEVFTKETLIPLWSS